MKLNLGSAVLLRRSLCLALSVTIGAIMLPPPSLAISTKRRPASQTQAPISSVTLKTPAPHTPLEHNNRGVELGLKGLWPDAIREHEIALNADPYNPTFRQNLSGAQMRYAIALSNKGNYLKAISHLREALYADANNAEADRLLDKLIEKTRGKNDLATRLHEADEADINGNFPGAIVEYRKCVVMDDSGPIRAKLGRVMLKQGKIRDGFAELKTAVGKTWPEDDKNDLAECHRQLAEIEKDQAYIARDAGRMPIALRRLDNAGIEYRRAVTLNPSNSDAIRGLIEIAREAVAITPTFNNHLMLAGAYQLAGDYDRARMEYTTCWHLDRNSDALAQARRSFHLAVVSHPRSQAIVADTVQRVEDALKKTPDDPELLYIYGRGKEVEGEPEVALKSYLAAAAINPMIFPDLKERIRSLNDPTSANTNKADSKPAGTKEGAPPNAGTGEGTGAKSNSTKPGAKATQPDVAETKNVTEYATIESKLRSNDIDGAQTLALALVDKDPHDAKGWLLLGRTHEKKNDLDQASVAYRQAAYLKDPDAQYALAQVNSSRVAPILKEADEAAKKANWVSAAASLKDAVTIAPNLAIVHRKLSEALKQLGDTKEALREAKKADDLEKDATNAKDTKDTKVK